MDVTPLDFELGLAPWTPLSRVPESILIELFTRGGTPSHPLNEVRAEMDRRAKAKAARALRAEQRAGLKAQRRRDGRVFEMNLPQRTVAEWRDHLPNMVRMICSPYETSGDYHAWLNSLLNTVRSMRTGVKRRKNPSPAAAPFAGFWHAVRLEHGPDAADQALQRVLDHVDKHRLKRKSGRPRKLSTANARVSIRGGV